MSKRGRPLKFPSVEELQKKIDEYFDITKPEEVTWTGLALHLDTSRETLSDYQERPEFSDSIKKALARVEKEYELDLRRKGRSGDIFALKNFGWKDKNETEHTGDFKINVLNYERDNNPVQLPTPAIPAKDSSSTSTLQSGGAS